MALLRYNLSAYGQGVQFTVTAETIFPTMLGIVSTMLDSFMISNKNTQIELEES